MEPRVDDSDRYPEMSTAGRDISQFMREHAHAPRFRNSSGHRLTPHDVQRVNDFINMVLTTPVHGTFEQLPGWLNDHVQTCLIDVPFYRRYGRPSTRFVDLPTTSRADLSKSIAAFVPDSVSLDGLINFSTSGTTGHPLLLASHPVVAGSYLAFIRKACEDIGIVLRHGRGQIGVALIGHQRKCFTYTSYTPSMDDSGLVKLNLHPDDWRDPDDRAKYLDALNAEVWTGDPISFSELLNLPLTVSPRVMISTSMMLLPGLRARLAARFGCPVLDFYSMNECGPIAFASAAPGPHRLLQPRLHVEVLDPNDQPCAPGTRGEVTLTGGYNPYLPLLRYRTGDHAALDQISGAPGLIGLSGRAPTIYRSDEGAFINNVDVTHVLKPFALSQWQLHQFADGQVRLQVRDNVMPDALRASLQMLFGAHTVIEIHTAARFEDKIMQYTSDLT